MKKLIASIMTAVLLMGAGVNIHADVKIVNLYDFYQSNGDYVEDNGSTMHNEIISSNSGISVTGGQTIYFGPCTEGKVNVAIYDSEENFLLRPKLADCTVYSKTKDNKVIYSYSLPEDAAFLWIAAENDLAQEFILTCGQPFDSDMHASYFAENPLTGKRALFIGDSICHGFYDSMGGHYGWAGRIGKANKMDWLNLGESGYSVSTCRQNSYGVIRDKLLEAKDRDFDYVLIQGGVNDAWDWVSMGTIADGYDPKTFDRSTFAGGLEDLFYNAYYYYGDTAAIGYLVNFSMPEAPNPNLRNMKPYFDMAKKICEKWNVRYFDMYENTKVYEDLRIGTTECIPDHTHPNSLGYNRLTPLITGFMKTLTVENMPGDTTDDFTHPYTDLNMNYYYGEAVKYCLMNGLMNGDSPTTFSPNKTVTRAMIVTVLYRMEQSPDVSDVNSPFTDVKSGEWYADAIAWAYSTGVVNGMSATKFNPTGELTREQFATILYRYAKELKGDDVSIEDNTALDKYTDKGQVSAYASDAMLWTNVNGYIGGVSATKLDPKSGATRAQMATILYRFISREV